MLQVKLSPSIFLADFWNLPKVIQEYEDAGVELIHFDVMDGTFVPNFALGHEFLRQLKRHTQIPIDAHLMVVNPERHIQAFADSGVDVCTVHVETCVHLDRTLTLIRDCGMRVGIALNPTTPLNGLEYVVDKIDLFLIMTVNPGFASQAFLPAMVPKVRRMRCMLNQQGLQADISVDGHVSLETIPLTAGAGANVFVLGTSSIYRPGVEKVSGIRAVRECAVASLNPCPGEEGELE